MMRWRWCLPRVGSYLRRLVERALASLALATLVALAVAFSIFGFEEVPPHAPLAVQHASAVDDVRCGAGFPTRNGTAPGGWCPPNRRCCSGHGFCGSSPAHCSFCSAEVLSKLCTGILIFDDLSECTSVCVSRFQQHCGGVTTTDNHTHERELDHRVHIVLQKLKTFARLCSHEMPSNGSVGGPDVGLPSA